PMWAAWLNFAVWTTIFLTACLVLRSRDKARR
ncbi:MAG: ABC transporter permease, partial [Staphylococcus hominis]